MALIKKKIKLRKMEQRRKALEVTNPKMAKKIEGKMEAYKGRKQNL